MKRTHFTLSLFLTALSLSSAAYAAPAVQNEGVQAPRAAFTPQPKADNGTSAAKPAAPQAKTPLVAQPAAASAVVPATTAAPVAAAPAVVTDTGITPPTPKIGGGPLSYAPSKHPIVLGKMQTYETKYEDTLIDVAQKFNIGYVELRAANPGVDAWLPGRGTKLVIPTQTIVPDGPREGILVNLSEMRLYSFLKDKNNPETFAIGVGREGFSTPVGSTSVVRKTKDPIWRPTDRMLREVPDLDKVVGPGPDNPLGDRAMYLGWPAYLIHGTNKPWGVGRRISSGCVRMYPDDVRKLFEEVPVGTKVTMVRQPAKVAWVGDMLYLEISPEGAQADFVENKGERPAYSVPADLFSRLKQVAGKRAEEIDWDAVRQASRDRYGFPIPVLKGAKPDQYVKIAAMTRPAQVSNTLSEADIDAAVDQHTAEAADAARRQAAKDRGEEADVAQADMPKRPEPKRAFNGGYNK